MILFVLMILLVGVMAWGLSKIIGMALSVGVFFLLIFVVMFLWVPEPLGPYLGWVRELVMVPVNSFRSSWIYVSNQL